MYMYHYFLESNIVFFTALHLFDKFSDSVIELFGTLHTASEPKFIFILIYLNGNQKKNIDSNTETLKMLKIGSDNWPIISRPLVYSIHAVHVNILLILKGAAC